MYSGKKLHKKLLPPELLFLTPICTKSFVGWRAGALPQTHWGAYSILPDP